MRPIGATAVALSRVLVQLGALAACHASSDRTADRAAAAEHFARAFYAWYVPRALAPGTRSAANAVLRTRASDLTPALFRALRDDLDAQAKATDEIVGIDFDPMVGGQDPCERYEVGPVRGQGAAYTAPVYGVCEGVGHPEPDAVAVLTPTNGGWQVADVRHPSVHGNLLDALGLAREDRAAAKR